MKADNLIEDKRVAVQHGEVFLLPVDSVRGNVAQHDAFIVGHSESGHNHVLESKVKFDVITDEEKNELYLRLFEPAKLVHKKSFDIHETRVIAPGEYKVYIKTEYDPFQQVVRNVWD